MLSLYKQAVLQLDAEHIWLFPPTVIVRYHFPDCNLQQRKYILGGNTGRDWDTVMEGDIIQPRTYERGLSDFPKEHLLIAIYYGSLHVDRPCQKPSGHRAYNAIVFTFDA